MLPLMVFGRRKLGNICCGHKVFLNKIRNIQFVFRKQNLCPQQMLRARAKRGNICIGNNVSATMCPCLPGPLYVSERIKICVREAKNAFDLRQKIFSCFRAAKFISATYVCKTWKLLPLTMGAYHSTKISEIFETGTNGT